MDSVEGVAVWAGAILLSTGTGQREIAIALWGSSQLLFAIIQLLVVVRYRSLVPCMWLMVILEVVLRQLVGVMKPVTFAHTPPDAVGNQLLLPLAAIMLTWSLWSGYRPKG